VRFAVHLDFPLAECRSRYERLQVEMTAAHVDGLLLTTRDNVEYLTGFSTPSWRLTTKRFWLLVPSGREPMLFVDGIHAANAEATSWVEDVRLWGAGGVGNIELAADAVRSSGLGKGTIGLELGASSVIRMTPLEYESLWRVATMGAPPENRVLQSPSRPT
jgi:Xaa-Pro aminopeptidase